MAIGTKPPPRNVFSDLDVDKSGDLTVEEMLKHFEHYEDFKGELPPGLMEQEDKDKNGRISWEEFSGPKGDAPPNKDEL